MTIPSNWPARGGRAGAVSSRAAPIPHAVSKTLAASAAGVSSSMDPGWPHHGEIPVRNCAVDQPQGVAEIDAIVVLGESGKVTRTRQRYEAQREGENSGRGDDDRRAWRPVGRGTAAIRHFAGADGRLHGRA